MLTADDTIDRDPPPDLRRHHSDLGALRCLYFDGQSVIYTMHMWGKVGVWSVIVVMVALWIAAVYFSPLVSSITHQSLAVQPIGEP